MHLILGLLAYAWTVRAAKRLFEARFRLDWPENYTLGDNTMAWVLSLGGPISLVLAFAFYAGPMLSQKFNIDWDRRL